MNDADLIQLVAELRKLPSETPWFEFKQNYANPQEIGQYLSALSNSAALHRKDKAYIVWGVEDETHAVTGTSFKPNNAKKGNEDLENWLLRLLTPRIYFRFYEFTCENQPIALLEIPRAIGRPVQFEGTEFVRVGSYVQKLKDHPQIEKELWRRFDETSFEEHCAAENLNGANVLKSLDYPSYFELLRLDPPTDQVKIIGALAHERLIIQNDSGNWNVTNLGAILFAKDLSTFKALARKPPRVIVYEGRDRRKTVREQTGKLGYAPAFARMIEFITALLPRNEVMTKALRKDVPMYPDIAVRELVANALIHQELSVTGMGPMIEIFADRIEITNPGMPLVGTDRFLDAPPRSRNEALASFLRRMGVCEERGSGIDKVVFETEFYQLPAPSIETAEGCTKVVLFAHKPLRQMDKSDRTRACYLHACLRQVQRDPMTNSSLRERFGIAAHNSATASRIITDAMDEGWIKRVDPKQGRKYAKYVPFWA
ncbi:MAG TPA: ATP-binding protein [Chthoniobacterales bacterium]|jgi:predicted HTH transcriptional regulator|nr:ATP-binding protein [Chthoniobacterales bacterium]